MGLETQLKWDIILPKNWIVSKCYNCDYEGEMEWFWLVTNEDDPTVCYATYELSWEDYKDNDTLSEIYICPKCKAEQ